MRNSPRYPTSQRALRVLRCAYLNPRTRGLLFPRGAHGLTDQHRRIGALARHELLRTAAPHLCRVEIAILVDAELMGAPQSSRLWRHGAKRRQQLSGQIELVELEVAVAVRRPDVLVRGHVEVIRRGGSVAEVPLLEELAVLVEDLDAAVAPVVDVDSALVVDDDAVHGIEVVGPPLLTAVSYTHLR